MYSKKAERIRYLVTQCFARAGRQVSKQFTYLKHTSIQSYPRKPTLEWKTVFQYT